MWDQIISSSLRLDRRHKKMFQFSPSAIFRSQHSLLFIYEKYDYTLPFGSFKSTPDFKPKCAKYMPVTGNSGESLFATLCWLLRLSMQERYLSVITYNVASFSIWFPSSDGKDLGTSGAGSHSCRPRSVQ